LKLGDTKFFNLFALVAAATNGDRTRDRWQSHGVDWRRERVSQRSAERAFQIELHTLVHSGRNGWTLLMCHESWWDGVKPEPFRSSKWTHLARGNRAHVLKWFAERESELD